MLTRSEIGEAIRDAWRILTFRMGREGFQRFGNHHLVLGLVCTWIVGIGRWWDDPAANLLQHLGVGSVIYIFVLSSLLWLVVQPFKPPDWSYKNVLTFVSLTSPPALLYAIPVERFMDLPTARSINVWFLAFVATWRVALLFSYFRRFARLSIIGVLICSLLPVMVIVATLAILNLERAVFDIMGGLRESGTSNDEAYAVLFVLTFLSIYLVVPVFVVYVVLAALGAGRRDKIEDTQIVKTPTEKN